MSTNLTDAELDRIARRIAKRGEYAETRPGAICRLVFRAAQYDAAALLAEVNRLRALVSP